MCRLWVVFWKLIKVSYLSSLSSSLPFLSFSCIFLTVYVFVCVCVCVCARTHRHSHNRKTNRQRAKRHIRPSGWPRPFEPTDRRLSAMPARGCKRERRREREEMTGEREKREGKKERVRGEEYERENLCARTRMCTHTLILM